MVQQSQTYFHFFPPIRKSIFLYIQSRNTGMPTDGLHVERRRYVYNVHDQPLNKHGIYNVLQTTCNHFFSLVFISLHERSIVCVRRLRAEKRKKRKEKKKVRPKYPNHQTRFMSKIKSFFVFSSFLFHAYCFLSSIDSTQQPGTHTHTCTVYDKYVLDCWMDEQWLH